MIWNDQFFRSITNSSVLYLGFIYLKICHNFLTYTVKDDCNRFHHLSLDKGSFQNYPNIFQTWSMMSYLCDLREIVSFPTWHTLVIIV